MIGMADVFMQHPCERVVHVSLFFLVLPSGRRGRGEVVNAPEVVVVELLVCHLRETNRVRKRQRKRERERAGARERAREEEWERARARVGVCV